MAPQPVPHQNPYGERISLELAKEIAEAGEAFAAKQGWNATIAICDDGGHLVLLHRMSNGQFGSVDLAPPKAYGAAAFRRSDRNLPRRSRRRKIQYVLASAPGSGHTAGRRLSDSLSTAR